MIDVGRRNLGIISEKPEKDQPEQHREGSYQSSFREAHDDFCPSPSPRINRHCVQSSGQSLCWERCMATYAYEAMNSSGQEVKDEIEAASSEEAIAKIRGKGFFPTKVREKAGKKKVNKKKDEETTQLTKKRKMP